MKPTPTLEKIFKGKELIIFDIDGTLVDVMQIHIHVIREAILSVTGKHIHRDSHITDYFGIPEYQSINAILKNRRMAHGDKIIRAIQKKRNQLFPKIANTQIAQNILPGVHAMLVSLRDQDKVLCTITGNTKTVGKTIIDHSGLQEYFDYCIYSDDLLDGNKIQERHELITIARNKYSQLKKKNIQKKHVIVAGDTPHDVEAAHAAGVDSIAVATGTASLASLRAAKPTFLLRNFKPSTRLL